MEGAEARATAHLDCPLRFPLSLILIACLAGCGGQVFSGGGGDGIADAFVPPTPDLASIAKYQLPWECGQSHLVIQGNGGDVCDGNGGDHSGIQAFAFDFAMPRHTPVLAARAGMVTASAQVVNPGQACYDGCRQPFGTPEFWQCCGACVNASNHVNVTHEDGTVATYWRLDMVTVMNGMPVNAGDLLGYSGQSGCAGEAHLHFQIMGHCPTGYCQSIPISFTDAGRPPCGRMPTSMNACH